MARNNSSPRLFVIFARESYEAVIFSRGPTKWYHVVRWDTLQDKFHHGAWIRGRIYPEKCDLSPNGELLLTFIHQGRKLQTDYTDAWSAVSRTPWLAALGLWPQGTTYGGGGRFIDDRKIILRQTPDEVHPKHPGKGLDIFFAGHKPTVPHHVSSEEMEGAEWSGRDQRGRLIYTDVGKLIVIDKNNNEHCLIDFNGLKPDPQAPPSDANNSLSVLKNKRKKPKRRTRG